MNKITFDERSVNWDPNPMYNKAYVASVQNLVNDMYTARGFINLLEIYNLLGVPYTLEESKTLALITWSKNYDEPFINVSNMVNIK